MSRFALARVFSRTAVAAVVVTLLVIGSKATAQHGLSTNGDVLTGPRLLSGTVLLGLTLSDPGTAPRAQLFGNHYLTGPGFGQGDIAGGLRITSGLVIAAAGPRRAAQGLPPMRLGEGLRGTPSLRLGSDTDAGRIALPYLGLGYTGLSVRDGWGFSADIGLGGLATGDRFRLGRSGPTAAQVENVLNDLRLAPVLQLGVSYAF